MRKTRLAAALLSAGILLLPLVCSPGLARPFSTPKIILLACLDLLAALLFVWGKPRPAGLEWPWVAWLAALSLSAATAFFVSLDALLLAALPVPLCIAVRAGLLAPERVTRTLVWGSAVESAIVLLQYAGADPLRWLGWHAETFANPRMRVYGTLGNPDFVAAWLCATLPLARGAGIALQLAAILATGSRVFLLALPVAVIVLALRRARIAKWWCLAGLPVAAAVLWLSPARPLGETVQGRMYLARVAVSHWRDIPVFGYGPGSFESQFGCWQAEWIRQHGPARFAGDVDHAHNDYLELLVEYGPIGLFAFLGLCGWLLARAWPVESSAGAWGGVAVLLAIACVDFPFHRPAEWTLYWLLLGIAGRSAPRASGSEH